MRTKTFPPFAILAGLATAGACLMVNATFESALDRPLFTHIQATAASELAAIQGFQEPSPGTVSPIEENKCCGVGGDCTPETPVVEGGVPCTTVYDGTDPEGCGDQEDKPCWAWSGNPVKDGACVDPPAGFTGSAHCSMDPRSFPCRKFRTGVCDSTFWTEYCYCDVDSQEVWAKGQKRCAQGSTLCSALTSR